MEAATRRLALGASFPLPTPEEIELATLLCERLPSAERVRFTNSGSEAVMIALKGARAFTGRPEDRQVRGRLSRLLRLRRGEPVLVPGDLGQPRRAGQHGLLAAARRRRCSRTWSCCRSTTSEHTVARIEREARNLAAVLVDPVPNRVGLVPAQREFLKALREVTRAHGIVLIFDEVISFRVGYQGAQGALGVTPDVTTLGKIIGGGFPVGAVAGRADVMACSIRRAAARRRRRTAGRSTPTR